MRYALATLAVGIGLIAAAPAQAQPGSGVSSDICRDQNACFAATSLAHVDLGAVRTNRLTTAVWSLRCRQGGERTVQRGVTEPGTTEFIEPTLNNPNCTLRARGTSDGVARVRVALT